MLSERVFQSILPLNDRELCPYEDVITFGIWRRLLFKGGFYSRVASINIE